MELRKSGVQVLTVYPGPIHTPMAERNWQQLEQSLSARMAPEGNVDTLARLVVKAVKRRRARVIYPRFYALAWFLPSIGRWVAEHMLPPVTGAITPPMEGDLVALQGGQSTGDREATRR